MIGGHVAVYASSSFPVAELQCHIAPGAGAYSTLYGWQVAPPPVDAGPPAVVEQLLATALVGCGALAFLAAAPRRLADHGWQSSGTGAWLRIAATLSDRVRGRVPPAVLATERADIAQQLFSGEVSWSQQQQIGLLLAPGQLPALDRQLVIALLNARGAAIVDLALPDEVIALALPAVDGDFLEVVARSPATQDAIRAAIADECQRRDIKFAVRATLLAG